jgi:N-acetylmuramoyl-L-alanine amidase
MRHINKFIIHCADTPEGKYFDADNIREWHKERGFNDIGYHYVILLDGTIQLGRDIKTIGAHARGVNKSSIGICYIGGKNSAFKDSKDTRTHKQKESLEVLLKTLIRMFPNSEILGHYQAVKTTKKCPSFDAKKEYKDI